MARKRKLLKRPEWGVCVLLTILGILVFSHAATFFAVEADDPKHIFENPLVIKASWENFLLFWKEPYFNLYIPVTYSIWMLGSLFSTRSDSVREILNPHFFHGMNIFFHIFNAILVFALIRFILRRYHEKYKEALSHQSDDYLFINGAGFVGACVFAFHPIQVEAVGWISGLKDLLSMTLGLSATLVYFVWRSVAPEKPVVKTLAYISATLLFVLSMLAKPSTIILPVVLFGMQLWLFRRPLKESTIGLVAWILLTIPIVILSKSLQPNSDVYHVSPLWARPWIAFDAFVFYLAKVLFPYPLHFDYGRTPDSILQSGVAWLTSLVAMGLFGWTFYRRKREPLLWSGAILFFIALLPVLGFLPFQFQKFSTVADRYAYFPMLILAIGAAWWWYQSKIKIQLVSMVFIPAWIIMTSMQLYVWRDSETLFSHTLEHNSRSYMAHNNLGFHYFTKRKYHDAAFHFRQVTLINPDEVETLSNLGAALVRSGKIKQGIAHFETVIQHRPKSMTAHYNLAEAHLRSRNFMQAMKAARTALQIEPDHSELRRVLVTAEALLERQQLEP